MELSKRMEKLSPERAFSVLAESNKLESQGKKILHFEIGQPNFPTPSHIVKAGQRALEEGKTRYTAPLGMPQLREAIAKHLSQTRNSIVEVSQIAVTPSPKTAIYLAMTATLNPGDEVIYPDPGFPTYEILTDFLGCVKKPVPLLEKNNFSFDMDTFKNNFSDKTKLVILNSPSNPTGGIISRDQLEEISRMVLSNKDCFVISDEIYSSIIYDGVKHESIYSVPGMEERVWLVDGFSKTYSMTGWRIGYLAFPKKFEQLVEWFATNVYSCVAQFSQIAALEALSGPQETVYKMVDEFKRRRDVLVQGLNSIKGVSCVVPEGAFYVFPNVTSFNKSSREIAEYLLQDYGIALLDGTAFGKYGEGYLRLSYANSMEHIRELLDQLTVAFSKIR